MAVGAGEAEVIPVYQTIMGPRVGNCWQACIASILEIPIDAVPNIQQQDEETDSEWYSRWQAWFAPLNLTLVSWGHDKRWLPRGYSILGCKPPGCDWYHAVVCLDGKVVWNPTPGYSPEADIGEWCDWTVFAVLDPAKPVGRLA